MCFCLCSVVFPFCFCLCFCLFVFALAEHQGHPFFLKYSGQAKPNLLLACTMSSSAIFRAVLDARKPWWARFLRHRYNPGSTFFSCHFFTQRRRHWRWWRTICGWIAKVKPTWWSSSKRVVRAPSVGDPLGGLFWLLMPSEDSPGMSTSGRVTTSPSHSICRSLRQSDAGTSSSFA